MAKGIIISGYQGVGKSGFRKAFPDKKIIDLDSSYFSHRNQKNWVESYCTTACFLKEIGYVVLVSQHTMVVDYLMEHVKDNLFVCVPTIEFKIEMIDRLKSRYENSLSEPDLRALSRAVLCYEKDVLYSLNDKRVEILKIDYDKPYLVDWADKIWNE